MHNLIPIFYFEGMYFGTVLTMLGGAIRKVFEKIILDTIGVFRGGGGGGGGGRPFPRIFRGKFNSLPNISFLFFI